MLVRRVEESTVLLADRWAACHNTVYQWKILKIFTWSLTESQMTSCYSGRYIKADRETPIQSLFSRL